MKIMEVVIRIRKCGDCPYLNSYNGPSFSCGKHTHNKRLNKKVVPLSIPNWCPLNEHKIGRCKTCRFSVSMDSMDFVPNDDIGDLNCTKFHIDVFSTGDQRCSDWEEKEYIE